MDALRDALLARFGESEILEVVLGVPANANSNPKGQWPVKTPTIAAGSHVTRTIAVFNDEFSGDTVRLSWQARLGAANGAASGAGTRGETRFGPPASELH